VNNFSAVLAATFPPIPNDGNLPGCSEASQCINGPSQTTGGGGGVVLSSPSIGIGSIVSVAVEILAIASLAALVGIIIIAVVANRADPDATGRRPQSVYYFVVSFVTITTSIVGSALFVASLLWLTAHHPSSANHSIARLMLVSVLIFVVSATLLVVHLRRGLVLAREDALPANPSHRVGQSYVSVVAFVSTLALLLTGIVTIYFLFAIAAPGTFGSAGGRGGSVRILVESFYLAVVAGVVLWTHGSLLTPTLGLFGSRSRGAGRSTPGEGQSTSVPLD
jgi:hypothetical protein